VKPLGLGWPNIISIVRIILVIPMVWLLMQPSTSGAAWAAFALFLVGAASDRLDGYLARRYDLLTATGAWLDPLADKLFVIAPTIVLSADGRFPWWATVIIIVREASISLLRWVLDKRGASMPASGWGKIKTVLQLVAIGAYLVPGAPEFMRLPVLIVAVIITVYSGVDYFVKAGALERAAKAKAKAPSPAEPDVGVEAEAEA